ncbi:sodium-dependent phosphate transport protein 2B-like, partial [Pollicipes pollicipes]|uniref:sodium-dependent phosphate transport protein 2B-like n=1 Tax=Pollicipes pollicipes TaxID=41117 RepID=UPI0018854832
MTCGPVAAGDIFAQGRLLSNPVVDLMLGCVFTLLVQSSSISTSIVVSMVAADVLSVRIAIPMVMGANIGTSITNDIVSLTQFPDRHVFERAFGGACAYDMFNLLSVLVMLPLELFIQAVNPGGEGYLEYLTSVILNATRFRTTTKYRIRVLQTITRPLTDRMVLLDEAVLEEWVHNTTNVSDNSLIVRDCGQEHDAPSCASLFSLTTLRDDHVGIILLFVSLFLMSLCLFCMVKMFVSVLKGASAARLISTINGDL